MEEMRIRRGEVWRVRRDDAYGHEISSWRPGVVLSSRDTVMDYPLVVIAFMTTTPKEDLGVAVKLTTSKKDSYVLCHQLYSIDESRLVQRMWKLSDEEMRSIDEAIGEVLNLPLLKKEDRAKVYELEKEVEWQRLQIDTLERLYEKSLEQYINLRIQMDTNARLKPVVVEVVEPTKNIPTKQEPKKQEPKQIKSTKVNVNTCEWKDLAAIGIPKHVTYSVTGTRKKLGRFETVDELLLCDRFTERHLEQFRDKLEV